MPDKNLQLTRRKILGSVGAVGLAGAAAGYGTSAFFSDEETFANNSLTAGSLDLTVTGSVVGISDEWVESDQVSFPGWEEIADGAVETGVQIGDMKPGDWLILCYDLVVETNPACLTLTTANTANDENSVTEPEADREDEISDDLENPNTSVTDEIDDPDGEGELAQSIDVTVYGGYDSDAGLDDDEDERDALTDELLGGVSLAEVWDVFGEGGAIGAEVSELSFCLLLELPTEVGNEVQTDSVEWDFVFEAVQSRHNECETPVWESNCEPECPESTNPDPGTDDFDVTVESIDDSGFPTIRATTRVNTEAGGNGDIPDENFSIDEETINGGPGSGFCGQTIQNVTFGGEQEETLADVMFVLDTSGSMGGTKIENAKDGAIELIGGDTDLSNDADDGGFDPTVNVGAVEFSSSASLVEPLGTDQGTVEESIDGLSAGGSTDIGSGISEANDQFFDDTDTDPPTPGPNNRANAPDFMIILGNGATSGGKSEADTAKNNGVTIFGIAYGDGADAEDFEEIAGEEPDDPDYLDYTFEADTDDITEIFDQIGQQIFGTYTLEYDASNCETDGLDRNVRVYVDDPDEGDADDTAEYTAPDS